MRILINLVKFFSWNKMFFCSLFGEIFRQKFEYKYSFKENEDGNKILREEK